MPKAVQNWNNREICELNRYNFLRCYSFMELIAYCISMHNIVLHIECMYYAISVPLIMTENMRFRPYSYPCFFLRDIKF